MTNTLASNLPRNPEKYFAPSERYIWNGENHSNNTSDDKDRNQYRFDEGRVLTEINREKLPIFVEKLKRNDYMNLRPDYQRRERWDDLKKSLFIESLIMNIPVPPIFLYEEKFGCYEVIDGQQRISAIKDFYNNELELTGLEYWKQLDKKNYTQLPFEIKERLNRRSIFFITVLAESAKNQAEKIIIKQLTFERINTGGTKLSRQETRNSLYLGQFNDLLKELSQNEIFARAWDIPIDNEEKLKKNTLYQQMEDVEFILRFFALRNVNEMRGNVHYFLTLYMQKSLEFNDDDIKLLRHNFIKAITLGDQIYGEKLFKPFNPEENKWELKSYRYYYDAVMVGLSNFSDWSNTLIQRKEKVIEETKKLFESEEQAKLFTGQGAKKEDFQKRIQIFNDMLLSILEE